MEIWLIIYRLCPLPLHLHPCMLHWALSQADYVSVTLTPDGHLKHDYQGLLVTQSVWRLVLFHLVSWLWFSHSQLWMHIAKAAFSNWTSYYLKAQHKLLGKSASRMMGKASVQASAVPWNCPSVWAHITSALALFFSFQKFCPPRQKIAFIKKQRDKFFTWQLMRS